MVAGNAWISRRDTTLYTATPRWLRTDCRFDGGITVAAATPLGASEVRTTGTHARNRPSPYTSTVIVQGADQQGHPRIIMALVRGIDDEGADLNQQARPSSHDVQVHCGDETPSKIWPHTHPVTALEWAAGLLRWSNGYPAHPGNDHGPASDVVLVNFNCTTRKAEMACHGSGRIYVAPPFAPFGHSDVGTTTSPGTYLSAGTTYNPLEAGTQLILALEPSHPFIHGKDPGSGVTAAELHASRASHEACWKPALATFATQVMPLLGKRLQTTSGSCNRHGEILASAAATETRVVGEITSGHREDGIPGRLQGQTADVRQWNCRVDIEGRIIRTVSTRATIPSSIHPSGSAAIFLQV